MRDSVELFADTIVLLLEQLKNCSKQKNCSATKKKLFCNKKIISPFMMIWLSVTRVTSNICMPIVRIHTHKDIHCTVSPFKSSTIISNKIYLLSRLLFRFKCTCTTIRLSSVSVTSVCTIWTAHFKIQQSHSLPRICSLYSDYYAGN